MKWLLVSPKDRRRAAMSAGGGVGALLVAGLAGGLVAPPGPLLCGVAGFVAFVLCARRSIRLWRIDEMVFDHRRPRNSEKPDSVRAFRSLREQRAGTEQSWRIS